MRLERELDALVVFVNLIIRVNDRTDNGVKRCFVGRNHAHVTAHYLNVVELALKRTVYVGNESLRTNTYEYLAVVNAGNVKNL